MLPIVKTVGGKMVCTLIRDGRFERGDCPASVDVLPRSSISAATSAAEAAGADNSRCLVATINYKRPIGRYQSDLPNSEHLLSMLVDKRRDGVGRANVHADTEALVVPPLEFAGGRA